MSWKHTLSHILRGQRMRATRPDTALPFCATLALAADTKALFTFARTGHAARALAALIRREEKEEEHFPTELWEARQQGLAERSRYALDALEQCAGFARVEEARQLITALEKLVSMDNVGALMVLPSLPRAASATVTEAGNVRENGAFPDASSQKPDCFSTGWETLERIRFPLAGMPEYRELTSHDARRDFLALKIKQLRDLSIEDQPVFWRSIGQEIIGHWIMLLEDETRDVRDWLKLAVRLPDQHPTTGSANLLLKLSNESAVVARDIRLQIDPVPGLHWAASILQHRLLEGRQSVSLFVNVNCDEAGSYPVTGSVEAQDLAGIPFRGQFSFRLPVGETGAPYVPPDVQPYQVGEGLGSDLTFVGRSELQGELRGLWRQSHGKPSVVLMGQRRIGKTSLLNKIQRDGLAEIRLHPLMVDIQGVTSAYDFLSEAARDMAKIVSVEKPVLERAEPYADFKHFLLDVTPKLDGWRFLLMLDEADLILQQRLGIWIPGLLRSLMQDPRYPTLLLFCGTHALKRIMREYDSILFNTAHVYTVGYMNETESHEVLEKPVRGTLEFAPATLEQAYHLTRGQPMLLQMIGMTLIRQFNNTVFAGEQRGNYVSLDDLERAVEGIIAQEGNAAFENHWNDNDTETNRVLSGLAWALDETNRPQRDIAGIKAVLEELKLSLPDRTLFGILEELREEEVLRNNGAGYRFAVPLYRRWIAWWWPPERMIEVIEQGQDTVVGKDNPLASGVRLYRDGYEIDSVLGQGDFGITYRARDTKHEYDIAIKEYFPRYLVHRGDDGSVSPNRERDEDEFKRGVKRFYDGARVLARITRQPDIGNIVRVYNYFEENGTAYMVMEYQKGESLLELAEREPSMKEDRLGALLEPMLEGLRKLHESGLYHRDLTPKNILVRKEDGAPILLDFGIAREATAGDPYSPPELEGDGPIGPWSDIFSLGAVLYRLIGGEAPPEPAGERRRAIEEGRGDPLKAAARLGNGRYPPAFLDAIDRALRLDATRRPQDVGRWKKIMDGEIEREQKPPKTDNTIALSEDEPVEGSGSISTTDENTPGNTDTPISRDIQEIEPPAVHGDHGGEGGHGDGNTPEETSGEQNKTQDPIPEEKFPPPIQWKPVQKNHLSSIFSSDGILQPSKLAGNWGTATDEAQVKTDGRQSSGKFGSHVPERPSPTKPFLAGGMPAEEKRIAPEAVTDVDESEQHDWRGNTAPAGPRKFSSETRSDLPKDDSAKIFRSGRETDARENDEKALVWSRPGYGW